MMKLFKTVFTLDFVDVWLCPGLDQDWYWIGRGKSSPGRPRLHGCWTRSEEHRTAENLQRNLWNDLDNAGIFDMVSKSFYPLGQVGTPADVKFEAWSARSTQRVHAGLWQSGRLGQRHDGAGLAIRREEHHVAPGAGQAVSAMPPLPMRPASPRTNLPMRSSSVLAVALPGSRRARFTS